MNKVEEMRQFIDAPRKRIEKMINEERKGEEAIFKGKKIHIATYFMEIPSDKEFINEKLDIIWNILQSAYDSMGGFKGVAHKSEFFKKINAVKLGFYNGQIVAVDVFNDYLGGLKSVGLAAVKNENHDVGVELVNMMIRENIHNINDYIWAEVSGRVETMYRQNGGLNIKSQYAPLYNGQQVNIEVVDEYHYSRLIQGTPIVKTIFGIKDASVIDRMMDKDAKAVREFISENESGFVNEGYRFHDYYRMKPRWENAKLVIDGLYDLYENYFYYEFPEDLYRALYKYFSIIEEDLDCEGVIPENMIKKMKICVNRAIELMKHVTIYKPFKLA